MNVLFRVDASRQIGTGHVMRCLSLADALSAMGAKVTFVCRQLPGHMTAEIQHRGYVVHLLEEMSTNTQDALATRKYVERDKVDWVVVDHYMLASDWEHVIRGEGVKIMVIDDLADRAHDCDLLLDQNLHPDPDGRYAGKVPATCVCLFGPPYALLGQQFSQARMRASPRNGTVQRLLLSFGGADATNETGKALRGIAQLAKWRSLTIDVVLGALNSHGDDIARVAQTIPGARVHTNVRNMAELMVNADVSFGGGGTTTWERCCLGVPTVVTIVAANQETSVRELDRRGVVRCLGLARTLTPDAYEEALTSVREEEFNELSTRGMALVDGQGCLRVAERMCTWKDD